MVSAALAACSIGFPVHGWDCSGSHQASLVSSLLAPVAGSVVVTAPKKPKMNVLVFSKTAGFRHDSIETGVATIKELGEKNAFAVDWTEDPHQFTEDRLGKYKVVVFLNTTGDVLNPSQQAAFEAFMRTGKGYVGIHAAADTEYGWEWYGQLVGAYFMSHPHIQKATVDVVNHKHPSTKHLPARWERTDEWYDYKAVPAKDVTILMKLDTKSYEGHKMGDDHPTCWCHEFGGGRAFYTGGGHTKESYSEAEYVQHILGGILWAGKIKK